MAKRQGNQRMYGSSVKKSGKNMNSDFDQGGDQNFCWLNYFLSKAGHNLFCKVEESYIHDNFNLYSLNQQVPYYDQALDLICDIEDEQDYSEDHQELIENDADVLYGLIHARYIVTNRGLQAMFEKYKYREFGECPYVFCNNKPMLPVGLTDEKNKESVKLYCPSCEGIYRPKSSRHENIDGAYFGTTFAHLFFLTFPELKPTTKSQAYVPKIYGFRVHEDAYAKSLEEKKALIRSQSRSKRRNR